jgi:hypothetical protein
MYSTKVTTSYLHGFSFSPHLFPFPKSLHFSSSDPSTQSRVPSHTKPPGMQEPSLKHLNCLSEHAFEFGDVFGFFFALPLAEQSDSSLASEQSVRPLQLQEEIWRVKESYT